MPIVSSLVVSHAPALFDGGDGCSAKAAVRQHDLADLKALKEEFRTAFKGTYDAAEMAKATKPEIIFLLTPHGMLTPNSYGVYLNSRAKGNAEWISQWSEYEVDVALDVDIANKFIEHLQGDSIPAVGIAPFDLELVAPLRWGEVVPLWFFSDITLAGVKVVIFTWPLNGQNPSETSKAGASIVKFLHQLPKRVLFVTSGELSHNHKTECKLPIYLPDPKWHLPKSPEALHFDLYLEHWVLCTPITSEDEKKPVKIAKVNPAKWDKSTYKFAQQWLARARKLQDTYDLYSCGIHGIGVVNAILVAEVEAGASYDAHVLYRVAPTYYGMMAAAFIKNN